MCQKNLNIIQNTPHPRKTLPKHTGSLKTPFETPCLPPVRPQVTDGPMAAFNAAHPKEAVEAGDWITQARAGERGACMLVSRALG